MKYELKGGPEVSEENILSRVTEYDIFSYYLGHNFTVGSKFNSPLRKDDNPSFGIFISRSTHSLLFKDQGTDQVGNCFKFVQLIETLSTYKEALNKVNEDLNLGLIKQSDKGIFIRNKHKASKTLIEVKVKNFTSTDDAYWKQFNINRDILRYFNVRPISHVWVNGKLLPWRYSKEEPMYSYQIYNKFKIYRPKSGERNKWLTNCTVNDLQGYEQLPERGKLLIITKSLKDVMALYSLGYTSIAVNSENTLIPKKIIKDIKNRFDRIIVFFDNDKTGIEGAAKFYNEYGFTNIVLPDKETKDISDYIQIYSKTKALKLIKNIIKDANITNTV